MSAPGLLPRDLRRVVLAAAVGNIIEWYDFYIFGSLAAILSVHFFAESDPVAALLSTVGLVPIITTAAYLKTQSLGAAPIYPIAVPAAAVLLGLVLMPETRQIKIWEGADIAASTSPGDAAVKS